MAGSTSFTTAVRPETALARWVRLHGLGAGLALVLSFLVLFPLVRLLQLSLEDGGRAFGEALAVPSIGTTLLTTALLGLGSLVISVVLGTVLAWFSLRLPSRWRWLSTVPILPMVLPGVAVVVGWAFLLSPQVGYINVALRELPFIDVPAPPVGLPSGPLNIYSVPGIILVTGLQMVPLVFLFVQGSLRQLNFESIEAAAVSGASPARAFVSVVLPLLRPALVYSSAFAMLIGLGQLTAPQFLGSRENIRVLATEIYRFGAESPTNFGLAAAISSPLLLAGIAFIIAQRMLLRDEFRFVTAGGRGASRPLPSSRFAAPVIGIFGVITLVLPFIALIFVSLSPYWTGQFNFEVFSLRNFEKALADPGILDALVTSVVTSLGAMAIALPLGYLLTEVLYHRRGNRIVLALLEFIVQVPLGVPAVVFGVGLLFVYIGNPFMLYGTRLLLVLTYVVIVLPFTVRMQLATRMTIGTAFDDASRASGAGVLRTHWSVVMPMMRGGLVGASVLMFVILSHEFAASMFVRSTRTQVLGTLLYDQWSRGSYPMVATVSIIMSVVTAVGLFIAVRAGGKDTLQRL